MSGWIILAVVVVAIVILRSFRPKQLAAGAHQVATARMLKVVGVTRETQDAVSLQLEDQSGAKIDFLPGQFFSLKFVLDGETVWRNYSICTPPGASPIAVAVKRTATGKVSNHINTAVKVGDVIEARGPTGRFVCEFEPGMERHHVLIAGGSGITPMMAFAQGVLENEPLSRVSMIYGNRRLEDVIFKAKLDELAAKNGERLRVFHALSEPSADWTGLRGILDAENLAKAIDVAGINVATARFYLCGPQPMMDGGRALLLDRGVPATEIHEERFSIQVATTSTAGVQPVTFIYGDERKVVEVPPNRTILEAGLAAGLQLDHSCTIGVCGTCILKKRSGNVQLNEGHCLSDDELAKGFVLVCCAHPTEPTEIEVEK